MEECFQLKEHGKLNLFEQANMTAEDRHWWLKRLEKEYQERNRKENELASNIPRPSTSNVSMPSMPSISRP